MKQLSKSKRKFPAAVAAAFAMTIAVAAGCSSGQAEQPAAVQEQTVKTVRVQTVTKQSIGDPIEQVADVAPVVQLDVIAKASGDVKEIVKKRGDTVSAGDVILRLDNTDALIQKQKLELQLTSSIQALNKARKDLEDGKREMANSVTKMEQSLQDVTKAYNKARNDYDEGLITKQQLEQAETQWKNLTMDLELLKQKQQTLLTSDSLAQLETQVESARLAMVELERALSHYEVKAPVSGILTELPVVEGMTLQAGMKVAHIQQMDPILLKAKLTENAAQLVRGKQELVYYVPGENIRGQAKITYLSDSMDAMSKSYELELEVANPDHALKPGMRVQVQLTAEDEQIVPAIPTLSVVREAGETYVFVLVGETVEKRKVELGRLNGLIQEVLSGVKEGEQLVVSGQNQLNDKEKVQLAAQ
jgi:multidrug efflux pump subunit AcrA (membrane-fusion protein)